MKLPSTAIFREGVKGKQRPFGLQLCAPHGRTFAWHFREGVKGKQQPSGLQLCAPHGRTFAWHFRCGPIDGENTPHSPFASVVCL